MKRLALLALTATSLAHAQTGVTPPPQAHIPPIVLMELRSLENRFDLALTQDCAPERCFSKGCVYRDHAAVDLPRTGSLPGLGPSEGPGSVPVQEYLTQARCEFTHEKSVSSRDVQALVKRLEQRLSKGWMQVSVGAQILAPVSASLRESPKEPEPKPAPPPPEPEPVKAEEKTPEPLPTWDAETAKRELWLSLLPHFSWMIALFLATLAAMTIIWALRRLGRESLEEKAMLAQLSAEPKAQEASEAPAQSPVIDPNAPVLDPAFVRDQRRVWNERVAQAELARDEGLVVDLLREWLRAGEFDLLAKAIFLFGDRLSVAFPSDGELAVRKVEFAEHLKRLDESKLPSDEDFFRTLNHHAISSSLLAQADAELYRSLREEFGAAGIASLVDSLPPRLGALMFALAPIESQHEVARILSPKLRVTLAEQLLVSNRISREETGQIFEALNAARAGTALPRFPAVTSQHADRGRPFDAATALSVLLTKIEPESRQQLFADALARSAGVFPTWYEEILYGDMILRVPEEFQKDMLLEVDLKGLAGWSSLQTPSWQESFIAGLAPTMQHAIRENMAFVSRGEQLRMARKGHEELVGAMKKLVSRGKVSFGEIVA